MARIGIVGSGVVGRATGMGFARWGHDVTFCDTNPDIVHELRDAGYCAASADEFQDVATDVTMLAVSTPTVGRRVELGAVRAASQALGRRLRNADEGHVVVVRSTLPPGTTEHLISPILAEHSGAVPGRDFYVTYNPEFLRQVSAEEDFLSPWLTVIGANDPRAARTMRELYAGKIPDDSLVEVSIATAEMIKYTSNLYNAAKISFSNEIGQVCRRLGIDGDEVFSAVSRSAEGMWNPNYGTRPGAPYGGACLPKDTQAFYAFARGLGMSMELLRAVISVNERMIEQARLEGRIEDSEWRDGVPVMHPQAAPVVTNSHNGATPVGHAA